MAPEGASGRPGPEGWARRVAPGLALCALLAGLALALAALERTVPGAPALGAVLWALLLGIGLRALWRPGPRLTPGITLSAQRLLEVAVVLFGALLSLQALVALGPVLGLGIPLAVAISVAGSYGAARALGVAPRMAALIASGNAICGNSAIAAAATVLRARPAEVSAAIALTALPGLAVTLALPALAPLTGLGGAEYGVLAGMMVYAVPQVLAATAPLGAVAVQVGVLVKLTRVLMLGPVLVVWSITFGAARPRGWRMLGRLVPWYVLGFFALAALRGTGLLPEALIAPIGALATGLTAIAMAALGLETDLRALGRHGRREVAAVAASLGLLGAMAVGLALLAP